LPFCPRPRRGGAAIPNSKSQNLKNTRPSRACAPHGLKMGVRGRTMTLSGGSCRWKKHGALRWPLPCFSHRHPHLRCVCASPCRLGVHGRAWIVGVFFCLTPITQCVCVPVPPGGPWEGLNRRSFFLPTPPLHSVCASPETACAVIRNRGGPWKGLGRGDFVFFLPIPRIESLNYQLRKATRNRSVLASDKAIYKIM
jgi:hypothetical protein